MIVSPISKPIQCAVLLIVLVALGCNTVSTAELTPAPAITATSIFENTALSPTPTSNVVLTAAANFPTPVLFPTSTSITISVPVREDVESFNFPLLPVNPIGNGENYITIDKNSTYLWFVSCAGKDAQDLQKNTIDMHAMFLINDQVIEKNNILEFDKTLGLRDITHTWAILISGWQANTTTKVEMRYSLYQVSDTNGLFTTQGDFYQIVYVNAH